MLKMFEKNLEQQKIGRLLDVLQAPRTKALFKAYFEGKILELFDTTTVPDTHPHYEARVMAGQLAALKLEEILTFLLETKPELYLIDKDLEHEDKSFI